jgi:hypothetical protein
MTIIEHTDDYILRVEITPVPALVDSFHVSFESQLLTAKDPSAKQVKFHFTGGGESLRVLADAIHDAIHDAIERPDKRPR